MHPKDADGMANSVDPDQTASSEAVWSWSALFAETYLSQYIEFVRYSICKGAFKCFLVKGIIKISQSKQQYTRSCLFPILPRNCWCFLLTALTMEAFRTGVRIHPHFKEWQNENGRVAPLWVAHWVTMHLRIIYACWPVQECQKSSLLLGFTAFSNPPVYIWNSTN